MIKRIAAVLLSAALCTACLLGLAACGANENDLVAKKPFPDFAMEDFAGIAHDNAMFADYDATVINFWSNGCGSCIAEMPALEELAHELAGMNVNLIGVATSAGNSAEERAFAQQVLEEKGTTYSNLIPDVESDFYQDFIGSITGYPTTYVVDSTGTIVGAAIIGDVTPQKDRLMSIVDLVKSKK